MKSLKHLLVLSVATIAFSGVAQAFDITPTAGVNFSKPSVSGASVAADYSAKAAVDFGVLASIPVFPLLNLQFGALYNNRKYGKSTDISALGEHVDSTSTYKYLQIPVVLRLSVLPGLSVGAGGYFATGLGDISTSSTTTPIGGGTAVSSDSTQSWGDAQTSKTDLGVIGSVAYRMPLAPLVGLNFDARYLLGLKNVNTSSSSPGMSNKWRSFQILAGVSLGL